MRNIIITIILLFTTILYSADVKISQLPLLNASATHSEDSFPMVDSTNQTTKRIKLYDLINMPTFVSTYAPLSNPTFTGTVTAPILSVPTLLTAGSISASGSISGSNLSGTNTGDQNPYTISMPNTLGSPVIMTDLGSHLDHVWSSGSTDGASITDNGDGTVSLTASTVTLRKALNVSSITRSGTTATVTTSSAHGYRTSDFVYIVGAAQTQYNGRVEITSTGANTFTYQVSGSPATPATGTITSINEHSNIYTNKIAAQTNIALTNHYTNYIYADFNNSSPQYAATTDSTQFQGLSRVLLWTVAREGNTLWLLDSRGANVDGINKINVQTKDKEKFVHADGGSVLSASGVRNISVTAGAFYHGLTKISHSAFDTSGTDTFTYVYQTSGTWTFTASQQLIDNTQYNNVGTGLSTLTTGNYGVHWVWIANNNPSTLIVQYGQGDYASESDARSASIPSLPDSLNGVCSLIGRVIIQKSASSFLDIESVFTKKFPLTKISMSTLSDVNVSSPNLNDILQWNGVKWVNGSGSLVSGSSGSIFYNATPEITATGTSNSLAISTLSKTPVTTTEQSVSGTMNTNTVALSSWLYDTALGKTSLDGGVWNFASYAYVNTTAAGRVTTLTRNIYDVIPKASGTVTTTGTGASRTATVSVDTPFVSGDASATNTLAGYLQTPQGLYQITAYTSSTVVTISTPSTYVNESGVTYNKWKYLFGAVSPAITAISPNYALYSYATTQPSYSVSTTDKLGVINFGTSNNTTVLTTAYNGTAHNTSISTPLLTSHNDLAGLQGGSGSGATGQYYHLTQAEYSGSGVGTGNIARLNSPTFTTPNIGSATGSVSGSAASFTGSLSGDVTGTQSSTAISASTVTGKALTGFVSGSGTVTSSDSILTAFNKLDGNISLKDNAISGVVNIADYGADPTGVSDSTTAIQNAINALSANGGVVRFPVGIYKITSTLTVGDGTNSSASTKSGIILQGMGGKGVSDGEYSTTNYGVLLKWYGSTSTTTPVIRFNGPMHSVGMFNISVDCNNTSGIGIDLQHIYQSRFENIIVYHYTTRGWQMQSRTQSISGVTQHFMDNVFTNIHARTPYSTAAESGLYIDGNRTNNIGFSRNTFTDCTFMIGGDTGTRGIFEGYVDNNLFQRIFTPYSAGVKNGVGVYRNGNATPDNFPGSNTWVSVSIVGGFSDNNTPGIDTVFGYDFTDSEPEITSEYLKVIGLDGTMKGFSVTGGTSSGSSLVLKSTSGVGSTDSISLKTGNNGSNTGIVVNSSGLVGIGMSPAKKLDITSSSNDGIKLTDGTTAGFLYASTDATNSLTLGTSSNHPMSLWTNNTKRLTILSTGNVGINNTSPGAKLDVSSEIRVTSSGGATGQFLADGTDFYVGPTGAHNLRLQTNGSTRLMIDSSGNVGVGATPTSKLTLNGSFARNIVTQTGDYTVATTDTHIICNKAGTLTLTLPTASSFTGREITVRTITANTVVSASSNVVPAAGGAAGTAILAGTAGKWALLVSDGTNWQIQMSN